MRFEGELDTVECESCGRTVSTEDDEGWEDNHLCPGCRSRLYKEFLITPCTICGKPMGKNSDPWYNPDEEYAHGRCIESLSDSQLEEGEWSNEHFD